MCLSLKVLKWAQSYSASETRSFLLCHAKAADAWRTSASGADIFVQPTKQTHVRSSYVALHVIGEVIARERPILTFRPFVKYGGLKFLDAAGAPAFCR
jgi:hypothetical protein